MKKIAVLKANASKFRSAKKIFGDILDPSNMFLILSAAFIFGWFPDGISGLIDKSVDSESKFTDFILPIIQTLFSSALILIMIHWFRKNYTSIETTIKAKKLDDQAVENIILFLSFLQPTTFENTTGNKTFSELDEFHSWIMPFKAIEHHKSKLRHLYIIPSFESDTQYDLFERLVQTTYNDSIQIYKTDPIDFENIDQVYETVDRTFQVIKSNGWKERDIVLDITGGQKVTSIVGAAFALGYDRRFQYVSTKDKKIYSYDLEYVWAE